MTWNRRRHRASRARPWRARRWTPAVAGAAVIVAIGLAAVDVGQRNLEVAEADRLASRTSLLTGLGHEVAGKLDPVRGLAATTTSRYTPEPSPLNEQLLRQVHGPADLTGVVFATLLDREGRPIQSWPEDVAVDTDDLGASWDRALAGTATLADAIEHDGSVVSTTLLPVGDGEPWGVLAMGEAFARTRVQTLFSGIGSQAGTAGGLFVADRTGTALAAWDPRLVGERLVTAGEVASTTGDAPRVLTSDADDVTTIVSPLVDGYVIGFQQETALLHADLRAAHGQRQTTWLLVLGAMLASLLLFQLWRELTAQRDEAKVDAILGNSRDVVVVVGDGATVSFLSAAAEPVLGQVPVDWLDRSVGDLCHPDDKARLRALVTEPGTGPALNLRLRAGDGGHRWFDVEASDLRMHPEVRGVLLTCHEVGERKALHDQLSHDASHDRLTGLVNRAELIRRLEALAPGGRPARPFAVLYIDLDHFKPVNDRFGHDVGDGVLVAMAERLRAAAGPGAVVARLGGDEFAIVIDGADGERARTTTEVVLTAVRAPVGDVEARLDASIGIALAAPDHPLPQVEELLRRADEAMYRAKHGGRGRAEVAPPAVEDATVGATAHLPEHPPSRVVGSDRGAPEPVRREPTSAAPPTTSRRRGRAVSATPALLAAVVVVAVAAVGSVQSAVGHRVAEAHRLREYAEATAHAARYYSSKYDPRHLEAIADDAPWTLDGSSIDGVILSAFAEHPESGPGARSFLLTPEGDVLASSAPGASTAVTAEDEWRGALGGRGIYLPVVVDPDEPRSYQVLPIKRDGRVAGVLAHGVSARNGPGHIALRRPGIVGRGVGGYSLLDADGVAYSSWDHAVLGERLASPAELRAVPSGSALVLDRPDVVAIVAPMTSTIVPTYLAFEVPVDAFYGDLRSGQRRRDLSLLGLVVAAVAGLALTNHRRERAARRRQARLDALLQHAHDVVVLIDEGGRASLVSSAVHRLLGYDASDLTGSNLFALVHPDDRASVTALVNQAIEQGGATATDVRVRHVDGGERWFDIHAADRRADQSIAALLLTCHEVSERKALQDELALRATRDPLTGLPNRAALTARLDAVDARGGGVDLAVLFIDLDHFKPVNDTFGHDAGDEVLRVIAERFRRGVRSGAEDAPDTDLVCRVGGDEFAVVLLDATRETAEATAQRLLEAARKPVRVGNRIVQIGATVGISLAGTAHEHANRTMRRADQAMYRAKRAGGDTFAFDGDELDDPNDSSVPTVPVG